jgi:hypothetical protein
LQADLVGDLVDHPQSVAFLTGPESIIWGSGLCFRCCASPCGRWLAVVSYLAVQRAVVGGDEQPPTASAVADGVGS